MDVTTVLAIIASGVVFGAWFVLPHTPVEPRLERMSVEVPESSPAPVSLPA